MTMQIGMFTSGYQRNPLSIVSRMQRNTATILSNCGAVVLMPMHQI